MQFVPFPLMKPLHPSSLHIFSNVGHTPRYASAPGPCIWKRIFIRSSGETIVLETAPATPPAMKDVDVGELCKYSLIRIRHVYKTGISTLSEAKYEEFGHQSA